MSYYSRGSNQGFRGSGFRGRGGSFRGRGDSYSGGKFGMQSMGRDRNDYSSRGGRYDNSYRDNSRGRGGFYGGRGGQNDRRFDSQDMGRNSRDRFAGGRHDRNDGLGQRNFRDSDRGGYGGRSDRGGHRMSHDEPERKRMRTDTTSTYSQDSPSHRSHRGGYGNMGGDNSVNRNFKSSYRGSGDSSGYFNKGRDFNSFKEPMSRRISMRGGGGMRGGRSYAQSSYTRGSRFGRVATRPSAVALHKMKLMRAMRMRNAAQGYTPKSLDRSKKRARDESKSSDSDNRTDDEAVSSTASAKSNEESTNKQKESKKLKTSASKSKQTPSKSSKDNEDDRMQVTVSQDSGNRNVSTEKRPGTGSSNFIKLKCVHCKTEWGTYQRYQYHLNSYRHKQVMNNVLQRLKRKLGTMRMEQRNEQRLLDNEIEPDAQTSYCKLCKLNYKQARNEHYMSDSHISMAEFLSPRCSICRTKFKNPIMYEHHRCSLTHLKRKAYLAKQDTQKTTDGEDNDEEEEDEMKEQDQFMVLDSVGSADEFTAEEDEEEFDEIESKKDKDSKAASGTPVKQPKEKPVAEKQVVKQEEKEGTQTATITKKLPDGLKRLGSAYTIPVEVYYCKICKATMQYYPNRNQEDILEAHLRSRFHLKRYVAAKSKKTAAAKNRIKSEQETEQKKDNNEEGGKEAKTVKNESTDEGEEKSWSDNDVADKDKFTDDDDEDEEKSAGSRFNKFGNSEKEIEKEKPTAKSGEATKKSDSAVKDVADSD